jgi:hypothetical protein
MKKERVQYFKENCLAKKRFWSQNSTLLEDKMLMVTGQATPNAHTDVEGDEADQAEFIEDFDSKIARIGSLKQDTSKLQELLSV